MTPRAGETEASVNFTAGELKLVSTPFIDFGDQDITSEEAEYAASSVTPVTQVSDLCGSGSGWDLNVALSPFTLDEGGGATLKAATITNPKVEAVNGNLGTPPSAKTDVVLDSDGTETPVWNAGTQAGMGVWNLNWNAADTKLTVKPGTAQEGRSVATLTWSLQTTP